ncbi:HepT-like ribonuclease domain-containing protein [Chelativorans sp. J32]
MRNRLSHGYGSVNWLVVWRRARGDIPALAERIRRLLGEK